MTLSACIMMFTAWIFIGFFTIKFFLKILKSPSLSDQVEQSDDINK